MLVKQVLVLNVRVVEMLFPTLVERRAKDDGSGFARVLVDTLRYTLVGLLLPAVALGGAAHGVMQVFGPGFDEGADALALLLIAAPVAAMAQIQRSSLNALDRPWTSTAGGLTRAAVTIGAGFALIPGMGATGAGLAFLLGTAADFAFTTSIVHRHLTVGIRTLWPVREWAALALAFGLGFVVSRLVYDALPVALGVVAAIPAGAGVYLAVLVLAGGINPRDRARLREVRDALARRRGRAAAGAAPTQSLEVSPS
jgi:O-antigen/teichoic acid export membrane protein